MSVEDKPTRLTNPSLLSRRTALIGGALSALAAAVPSSRHASLSPIDLSQTAREGVIGKLARTAAGLLIPRTSEAATVIKQNQPQHLEQDVSDKDKLIIVNDSWHPLRDGERVRASSVLTLDQIVDMSAPTFEKDCGKYAHVAGRPELKLGNNKYLWVIAYADEIQGTKAQSADNQFRQDMKAYGETATMPFNHFFGFRSTQEIYPDAFKLSKMAMSYSDNALIMTELLSSGRFDLVYKNGVYSSLGIILLADQATYDRLGASAGTNGDHGIAVLPADVVFDQDKNYAIVTGTHELTHALGIREHSKNTLNFLYAGIGTNDNRPKIFESREASLLCGGGQVYMPNTMTGFVVK